MSNIGELAYKMVFDTSELTEGMVATRQEMRTAKRIIDEVRTPTEKYADSLDQLRSMLNKKLLTVEDYNRAAEELKSELPEVREEQERLNRSFAKGEQLTQALLTPHEKYAQELDHLIELLDDGSIEAETYNRALKKLDSELPEVREEQDKLNRELKQAEKILEDLKGPADKYADEVRELDKLLHNGRLEQEQYNDALFQVGQKYKATAPAASGFLGTLTAINPATVAVTAGLAVATGGLLAFRKGFEVTIDLISFGNDVVNEHAEKLDVLTKQARKLGVEVNSLEGIRKVTSELSGLGESATDTALQRLTRRLSEAAQGTGEARGALAELGVDARAMSLQSPLEALLELADRFERVENQGDRVRLAFKLFDTEGVDLANTLGMGRDAIQELLDKNEQLVGRFSETDLSGIESMNDAWGDVSDTVADLGRDFTVEMAPVLTEIGQGLATFLSEGSESGAALRDILAEIPPTIELIVETAGDISPELNKATRAVRFMVVEGELLQQVAKNIGWLASSTIELGSKVPILKHFASALSAVGLAADFVLPDFEQVFEEQDRAKELEARRQKILDQYKELEEARNKAAQGPKILGPSPVQDLPKVEIDGVTQQAEKLLQSWEAQTIAIGQGTEALALQKLKAQGLGDELAAQLAKQNEALQNARADQLRANTFDQVTSKLKEQIKSYELSEQAFQRWQLAQQGLSSQQLNDIDALNQRVSDYKNQQKEAREAEQLNARFQDPLEKFQERYQELNDLASKGWISKDIARAALMDTAKQLDLIKEKAEKPIRLSFSGVDGVLKGSAAEFDKIARQKQILSGANKQEVAKQVLEVNAKALAGAGDKQDQIASALNRLVKLEEQKANKPPQLQIAAANL